MRMAKSEVSESEFEEEERNVEKWISDYEKQRLSRIAENRARMEALGLHKMASSLMASSAPKSIHRLKSGQRKGKTRLVDYDDDYRPDDDDDDDDDDEEDDDDEDEDFVGQSSSKSRRNKAKSKVSKPNKKSPVKHFSSTNHIDEEEVDDDELMQAISLSLQDSAQDLIFKERKENASVLEDARRRKRKKSSLNSRVQMTEDELVLHFFQFDEEGRGLLTVRDLQRLATAHDFTWTDRELADMIHFFDSDGDGKLTLDDFRKIAGRCNMMRGSENS